jgi:hypothetical protein
MESNDADPGARGTPDPDHGEVEEMDQGHLGDLARQHVSLSSLCPANTCSLIAVDDRFDQSRR